MMKRLCALVCALVLAACCASADAVYEIFVGSFADSDGDGVGDLKGVADKLPYVKALGMTGVWLTPVHPSPSYHHYDVTDYDDIDPALGTVDDFTALCDKANALDIDIIMDLVLNHTSSEHPWFKSACRSVAVEPCGQEVCACDPLCRAHNPYVSYYTFTKDKGDCRVEGTSWYYEAHFGFHMPDLNLDSPLVRGEIARIVQLWVSRGARGFRLDAAMHYYEAREKKNIEFLTWLDAAVRAVCPDAFIVAEAWTSAEGILPLYQSGIDALFAFPLADTGGAFVTNTIKENGAGYAQSAARWAQRVQAMGGRAVSAPFIGNHDLARTRGMLRSNTAYQTVALRALALSPGVPFVYYGEELGMSGSGVDENKRLPMLWSAKDNAYLCAPPANATQTQKLKDGADAQEADPDSLLSRCREAFALRALCPELTRGRMEAIDAGDKAVALYTVQDGGSTLTVAINFSTKSTRSVRLAESAYTAVGLIGGAAYDDATHALQLPPCACAVLRTKE